MPTSSLSSRKRRDERDARGSEADVAGAYNDAFGAMKRTGKRTSMITDPPNGRIPPTTAEAQKIAAEDRDFRLALMQATQTCKLNLPGCAGGKFDPQPTSRRAEICCATGKPVRRSEAPLWPVASRRLVDRRVVAVGERTHCRSHQLRFPS